MSGAQAYDSREEWRHFDFAHIAAPAAWRTVSALETIGIVVFDLDRYEAVLRLLYVRDGALEAAQAAYRLGGKDGLRGYALSLLAQD